MRSQTRSGEGRMRLIEVEARIVLLDVVAVGRVSRRVRRRRGEARRRDQAAARSSCQERGRDVLVHGGDIPGDPAGMGGAGDHGSRHRVGEGELQGRGLDADAVPLGQGLELPHPLEDLRRRRLVFEVGAPGLGRRGCPARRRPCRRSAPGPWAAAAGGRARGRGGSGRRAGSHRAEARPGPRSARSARCG